ncbi:MAG TPA: TIGR04283 family arsenosugar biosynthesis glycosyltransferase [Burkholderiales bacterium]|nr:TIGR04283 family arsenosugar biosynthesis glycosyltransferase [Burkholderiales bacterium]
MRGAEHGVSCELPVCPIDMVSGDGVRMISVIIPALNEEKALPATLARVLEQARGCEIIVVDGGSTDATCATARSFSGVELLTAPRGRASQMNAGARVAGGSWLLFLHADTLLPQDGLARIAALPETVRAGCFRHRFSGEHLGIRFVSWLHNLRCACTGVIYGDQAMFIRRSLFESLGGFPDVDVLEDLIFGERLARLARPTVIPVEVVNDSRKFVKMGVLRSFVRVLAILVCYELRLPLRARAFFDPVR